MPLASRRPLAVFLLSLVAAVAVATPAYAGAAPAAAGLDEKELRTLETRMLGHAHAAEHAKQRQLARRERARLRRCKAQGRKCRPRGVAARRVKARAAALPDTGRWNPPFSIPVMAIHAAVLPTGKVMWFAYQQNPARGGKANTAQMWLWDPATGATKRVDPPLWRDPADGVLKPANIWCGAQSLMADGQVLVTGGNLAFATATSRYKGLNKVYTFDPFTETWAEQPDMAHGRWYPTNVLMPDGRTLIMSGWDEYGGGVNNRDIEVFTPPATRGGRGTITLLGRRGGTGEPPNGGMYPSLFGLPSGRTLVAGPQRGDSWLLEPPGSGNLYQWTDVPNMARDHYYGPGVTIPNTTRVLLSGGRQVGNTAEWLDTTNTAAGWRSGYAPRVPRSDHNIKLLPDGSMIAFGGGYGDTAKGDEWTGGPEHRQIELFDPATGTWTIGPAQAETRAYHSTALLLPDGRVVSAGDDVNGGVDRDTAEIYEPPYLFKGPRPKIESAPAAVRWGATFTAKSSGAPVTRAVMMGLNATTHANDMSQRYVPLTLNNRPDGSVDVVAPPNAGVAPPGYYMLFLLSDKGVPSVATMVRLAGDAPVTGPDPTPTPTPTTEDKAAGKPASASSTELGRIAAFGPAFGNDGNLATRWASDYVNGSWWQVDLGRERSVSRVTVDWEAAYASRYSISVSKDNAAWTKVADVSITRAGVQTTDFAAHAARYVRVTADARATEWGASFWDVKVFGPDDTAPQPPPNPQPVSEDKAAGKPATASSTELGMVSTLGPAKGNDGSSATRWSSGYVNGSWWQVDLGRARSVHTVSVNWEEAHASTYTILTSTDGAAWSTAATVTGREGVVTTQFANRTARYVRIRADVRATEWGASFWDAQVYGVAD